ncbi:MULTISPECIES: MFS transporter [Pseudomonas]|uniref:MFS transporter n=1 Tax=Pseudomonas TaxID=286 RepID=UPI001BEB183E|nr:MULTISPECIES: MFS transporter [Pseudomonas]MBT2338034.1 MFS transporter [Pseudomonas fluorescens]MCD4527510.1 MFS transporter [Pseudomonas sp. C3-2018]
MTKYNSSLLWALALAVFAIITTELGIIGLLLQLVSQRGFSAAEVGLLVSAYAIVVAVTGPFTTLLMSRWNKKHILLGIMLLFVITNIVSAYADNYSTMMWFRILPALVHAPFFAVTLVVAANSVAPENRPGATAKVFAGVAVGLVLGVPLSAFIADHFSLPAAFLFGAWASGLAFVAIGFLMPSMPTTGKVSLGKQLAILRRGKLWLTIATVVFVFAAMFSAYSFIAEYLRDISHMDGNWISAMLMLFGVFGIIGNFIFSRLLQKNIVRTVVFYPLLYIGVYLLVYGLGFSLPLMVGLVVLWGLLHSAGLVVSQTWLMREAQDAPEFANSLYISFSNLGITLGTILAGWFITHLGTHSLMWSSILFAALALLSILIKIGVDRSSTRSVA